ncbi:MAG: site-specific DNA-methyltransferase [Elusimicrobia bacterium]|nr:site-specific DNA-methyltransferase [Elusimicrobiota bacterium]
MKNVKNKYKKIKKENIHGKISEYRRQTIKEIKQADEEVNIEIPKQAEFFKTPVRFGNIPVDKLPLGCDEKEQYRKIYPKISLPFQVIERVSFGHKDLEPNQLIFGDNLHIMRALPSNFIDLIYIDPPFFSGRNYNVVFGDQNEVRSFTDIWEGGMPGYLIWLNSRILEMKRLLKPTGSILVHCDWHASHYIKLELDKIFGYDNFRNEIVWRYRRWPAKQKNLQRMHDIIFWYSKGNDGEHSFKVIYEPLSESTIKADGGLKILNVFDENGNRIRGQKTGEKSPGAPMSDVWEISLMAPTAKERIGYPTQKPGALMERILETISKPGDIIADFFCGGGTTPAVAQKLGRRWIASDISKIAVSVTRDRLLRSVLGENKKEVQQSLGKVPDIEIKNWGVYEVPELVKMKEETFRNFIISAYNGRLTSSEGLIHGYKQSVPLFVGSPSQDDPITESEVVKFAKDIVKRRGHHQGIMIAWGFTPGARNVAKQLEIQHAVAIDFVKLQLVPIESNEFKEHVTSKHPEYKNLLRFILPPQVRISTKRTANLEYEFDVSESVSLNQSGKIINVQWDFSYNGERFISTPGYSFLGMKDNKPVLRVIYKFISAGKKKVACKVQDDEGGEKIEILEIDVK